MPFPVAHNHKYELKIQRYDNVYREKHLPLYKATHNTLEMRLSVHNKWDGIFKVLLVFFVAGFLCPQMLSGRIKQKKTTKKNVAPLPSVETLFAEYRFDEAVVALQQELRAATSRQQSAENLQDQLRKAQLGAQMLRQTAKVIVIDSIVVSRQQLLSAYKIGADNGFLAWGGGAYPGIAEGVVHVPSLKDRVFVTVSDTARTRIAYSYKLNGAWDVPVLLPGLSEEDESQSYPYIMPDGMTLYYAADGTNCLGGTDIKVTQYDENESAYRLPENLGMPFNSPYNDFLYVIDEDNRLGWFASDRNQPEGKVCVYVFIPPTKRSTYGEGEISQEELRKLARLTSIKDTWKGHEAEVAEAKGRLRKLYQKKTKNTQEYAFEFVVNDLYTYTDFSQFKKAEAAQKAHGWYEACKKRKSMEISLSVLRDKYAKASVLMRGKLEPEILKREEELDSLENQIILLEKEMRKIELNK